MNLSQTEKYLTRFLNKTGPSARGKLPSSDDFLETSLVLLGKNQLQKKPWATIGADLERSLSAPSYRLNSPAPSSPHLLTELSLVDLLREIDRDRILSLPRWPVRVDSSRFFILVMELWCPTLVELHRTSQYSKRGICSRVRTWTFPNALREVFARRAGGAESPLFGVPSFASYMVEYLYFLYSFLWR